MASPRASLLWTCHTQAQGEVKEKQLWRQNESVQKETQPTVETNADLAPQREGEGRCGQPGDMSDLKDPERATEQPGQSFYFNPIN